MSALSWYDPIVLRRSIAVLCLTLPLAACSSDPEVARNNPSDASLQLDADAPDSPGDAAEVDAPAESSKDSCVATCFGRQCGSDGCGGICAPGCAQGTACLDDGTCEHGCVAAFSTGLIGPSLRSIALDSDGLLYASGVESSDGVVRVLSACNGATQGEAPVKVDGALLTRPSSVAIAGDFLYVGGSLASLQNGDPGAGFAARISKTLLAASWSATFEGTQNHDELHFLSVDDTGAVWAGGTLDILAPEAWLLRIGADGKYCTFDCPGTSGSLWASYSAPGSGVIYLAGEADGKAFVSRYASGSCWQTGSCADPSSCQPAWTATFDLAGRPASPRDLVVAGGYAYVAGEVGEHPDKSGFVAAVSLSTGNVGAVYEYNPTSEYDTFLAIAADAESGLYVTGSVGWDGDTFLGATRVTAKLVAPTLELAWKYESSSDLVGRDIAIDATDGVYFVADTPDGSRLVRCTKAGLCP